MILALSQITNFFLYKKNKIVACGVCTSDDMIQAVGKWDEAWNYF